MNGHTSEPLLVGGLVVLTIVLGLFSLRKSGGSTIQKIVKITSGFLGAFLLMGGTVKFFEPFNTMFANQISLSDLPFPALSNIAGQFGEISVGITLLIWVFINNKIPTNILNKLFYLANIVVVVIMLVAVYVHLHPDVPAETLPFGTKPPYLTVFIMLLAIINMILHKKKGASYVD